MKLQHRTYPFELRMAKPDGSYFEGHCAVFHGIDEYQTIMGRGCFDKHLEFFKTRGFLGGLNHNWDEPIGTPSMVNVDNIGLMVGGDVLDTSYGLDVRKLLASKTCRFMSFGFDVLGRAYLETAKDVEAYWQGAGYTPTDEDRSLSQYGACLFTELRVYEASPVMVPGNKSAEITSVRDGSAARPSLDEFLRSGAASVEELCGAVERYLDMRSSTGRGLQPERRAFLKRIHDRVGKVLAGSEPKADPAAVLALRRELLSIEAGILAH